MSPVNAYIFFDGTCAEAMRFYERTLGGKLEAMMTYADAPPAEQPNAGQMAPGGADRIMHASLSFGGGSLMASDSPPGGPYKGMHGFSLSLGYPNLAEARKVFDALGEGGTVTMPLQKTFWTEGFGMLTDRFGAPWMVNVDHASP